MPASTTAPRLTVPAVRAVLAGAGHQQSLFCGVPGMYSSGYAARKDRLAGTITVIHHVSDFDRSAESLLGAFRVALEGAGYAVEDCGHSLCVRLPQAS